MVTSNLEIGRAGRRSPYMEHPHTLAWRSGGGRKQLTISGHLKDTTTLEEALVLRDQLLGQVRRPGYDGLVAVHSNLDPTINGFYFLESANVTGTHSLASMQGTGFFTYSAVLTDTETNMFECVVATAILTNVHSKTALNTDNWMGAGLVSTVFPAGSLSGASNISREVEDRDGNASTIVCFRDFTSEDSFIWSMSPNSFYTGGCELRYGGFVVTGTPTFDGLVIDTTPPGGPTSQGIPPLSEGDWEINNGLIRVKGVQTSGNRERFTIEMWDHDDLQWEAQSEFMLMEGSTPVEVEITTWDHLIVLRNDPEEVAIRLVGTQGSVPAHRVSLDMSLRRGCHFVRCYWGMLNNAPNNDWMGVGRSTTEAATAFTYGIHATAGEHRWILGSRHTVTNDLTNGRIRYDVSGVTNEEYYFDFFIGMEYDGASAGTVNTAVAVGDHYVRHVSAKVYPILPGGAAP